MRRWDVRVIGALLVICVVLRRGRQTVNRYWC